eukprot:gene3514-biopygen21247
MGRGLEPLLEGLANVDEIPRQEEVPQQSGVGQQVEPGAPAQRMGGTLLLEDGLARPRAATALAPGQEQLREAFRPHLRDSAESHRHNQAQELRPVNGPEEKLQLVWRHWAHNGACIPFQLVRVLKHVQNFAVIRVESEKAGTYRSYHAARVLAGGWDVSPPVATEVEGSAVNFSNLGDVEIRSPGWRPYRDLLLEAVNEVNDVLKLEQRARDGVMDQHLPQKRDRGARQWEPKSPEKLILRSWVGVALTPDKLRGEKATRLDTRHREELFLGAQGRTCGDQHPVKDREKEAALWKDYQLYLDAMVSQLLTQYEWAKHASYTQGHGELGHSQLQGLIFAAKEEVLAGLELVRDDMVESFMLRCLAAFGGKLVRVLKGHVDSGLQSDCIEVEDMVKDELPEARGLREGVIAFKKIMKTLHNLWRERDLKRPTLLPHSGYYQQGQLAQQSYPAQQGYPGRQGYLAQQGNPARQANGPFQVPNPRRPFQANPRPSNGPRVMCRDFLQGACNFGERWIPGEEQEGDERTLIISMHEGEVEGPGDVCVELEDDPLMDRVVQLPERLGSNTSFLRLQERRTAPKASHLQMRGAVDDLVRLTRDPEWQPLIEDGWKESLESELPDPDAFKAGTIRDHGEVWKEYFQVSGGETKKSKEVMRHEDFTRGEVVAMKRKGVVRVWDGVEAPVVVNGLRVVEDKLPKLRLCINPSYPNLFWQYRKLQYERLGDLVHLAREGDWAFTTDDKSGYWHVPLHTDMWQYLAFSLDGEVLCFTHLPFGPGPACFIYSQIKEVVFSPLRRMGVRMLYLIDDELTLQEGEARTQKQAIAMARLLASLGFILSLSKCQLKATQVARFLGMMVDLREKAFSIPEDKKSALAGFMRDVIGRAEVSDRVLASMAGKIMALAPAMELAPLLARDIHKARMGALRWDQVYPSPEALKADAELMLNMMEASSGKKWFRRPLAFRLVGDASESCLAAFTPDGEFSEAIVQPFTTAQMAAVANNEWSSSSRELSALEVAIEVIHEQRPGFMAGKRLCYGTDSMVAMQTAMGMKGNGSLFPIVKRIRLRCFQLDVELDVEWRPREHPEQQLADDHSKLVDNSDWSLQEDVYRDVVNREVLGGRKPTLDVFARGANTRVVGAYYSKVWGIGCKGIDAFDQSWVRPEAEYPGVAQLAYINGPFNMMGEILEEVRKQRVDCIVIVPVWPKPWRAILAELPIRDTWDLPMRSDLWQPGALIPLGERKCKGVAYKVQALYVLWKKLGCPSKALGQNELGV